MTDETVDVSDSAHTRRLSLPVGYSALSAGLTSSTPVRHRRQRAEAFALRYSRLPGKHVHAWLNSLCTCTCTRRCRDMQVDVHVSMCTKT